MSRFLTALSVTLLGVAFEIVDAQARDDIRPVAAASTTRAATTDELAMLNDVLHKTAGDFHRWAYTEHRIMRDEKGRMKADVLIRFDPSKPYAEQWTPLKIDGKEPSEREKAKYRR